MFKKIFIFREGYKVLFSTNAQNLTDVLDQVEKYFAYTQRDEFSISITEPINNENITKVKLTFYPEGKEPFIKVYTVEKMMFIQATCISNHEVDLKISNNPISRKVCKNPVRCIIGLTYEQTNKTIEIFEKYRTENDLSKNDFSFGSNSVLQGVSIYANSENIYEEIVKLLDAADLRSKMTFKTVEDNVGGNSFTPQYFYTHKHRDHDITISEYFEDGEITISLYGGNMDTVKQEFIKKIENVMQRLHSTMKTVDEITLHSEHAYDN